MSDNFSIFVSWPPRAESVDRVWSRLTESVEALEPINPDCRDWKIRDAATELKDKWGAELAREPEARPIQTPVGFMIYAGTDDASPSDGPCLVASNCVRVSLPGMYGAIYRTAPGDSSDPAKISYPVFRAIMLELVPIWDATYALAHTTNLSALSARKAAVFDLSWITYLSPTLAKKVAAPPDVPTETTPVGGLFLAATTDLFDANNPQHVENARAILAAVAPINTDPYAWKPPGR